MTSPGARALFVVSLLGCAHQAPPATPAVPATAPTPAASAKLASSGQLELLVQRHCVGCHDQPRSDRPLLTAFPLPPDLVRRALVAVRAKQMPPEPATLPSATRDILAQRLCESTGDGSACAAGDVAPAPLLRTPSEYLRALGLVAPPGAATTTSAEDLLKVHVGASTRVVQLDPTLALDQALIADERCAQPGARDERWSSSYGQCVHNLMRLDLARVPRPVTSSDAPVVPRRPQ